MSEKRHRQQQRRERRKAKGQARSTARARDRRSALPGEVDLELRALLAESAAIASRDADEIADALEAEEWGSCLIGTMHGGVVPSEEVEAAVLPRFVEALEALGTRRALATLRALGAVGAPEHARRAAGAGDRLAATGLPEPPWATELGGARPTAAALMYEEAFDDGLSVMVEFTGPGVRTHTVAVYIDHNLGGLVKHVFLAGPLSEIRADFERAPGRAGAAMRDLDFAEARARVEAGLDILDHTWDPPVNEDVHSLRALIESRVRLLPDGFELPDGYVDLAPEEREALLEDFLCAPEGRRWRGDEDGEDVVSLAIEFGVGYNHGGPLRWSPVVVEIFMTSWLARKVGRESRFFERVPAVLRDWVTYAGRRRGVPATPLRDAVAAVKRNRKEMLRAVDDPGMWGPAKAFTAAALDAGVELTDPEAVERFIARYNDGLAA
jgi:hypothetical protein